MTASVENLIRFSTYHGHNGDRENNREDEELYGRLDRTLDENESAVDFLEQAVKAGLYFPITASREKREGLNIKLHMTLWQESNFARDEVSDEKYTDFCKSLIKLLISTKLFVFEKELTLAELYRNIGDFEEAMRQLGRSAVNSKTQTVFDAIKKEIEKKNTKTAIAWEGGFPHC